METEKMIIFELAKRSFTSMHLDANKRSFHRNQLFYLIQYFLAIITQLFYFIFEANMARQYMDSALMATVGN